ncbi:MAG: glycosyltransferase family 2 protein [Lachnospirales bacterium]
MFLISCIIPIYNSQSFLKETIESVICQSIGFEKIQLILINDGSFDESEAICMYYKNKYSNVEYHFQLNLGVSVARNQGISFAKSDFISFLDSDDLLCKNYYEAGLNFFYKNNVDLVAYPIKEMRKNVFLESPFPPRFNTIRVINVENEYKQNQFSACSVLIRTKALKNLKFNKNMHYSEDAEFIHKIILRTLSYGVTNESFYIYRKNNSSVTKNKLYNLNWYQKDFQNRIIQYSIEKYGYVTKYTQNLCLYELTSFFIKDTKIHIDTINIINGLKFTLKFIDDDVIENSDLKISHKLFIFSLKGYDILVKTENNLNFMVGKVNILLPLSVNLFAIKELSNNVYISGYFSHIYDEISFLAKIKGKIVNLQKVETDRFDTFFLGVCINKSFVFENVFENCEFNEISFFAIYDNIMFPISINLVNN